MKKVFNILRRVVASVWMPPVALVGIVLAIFVEDAGGGERVDAAGGAGWHCAGHIC